MARQLCMIVAFAAAFAAAVAGSIAGCSDQDRQEGKGWRVVDGLEDKDIEISFVQVDQASAHDPSVYRDAASKLCGSSRCFQIGFFAPGDRIPPRTSRAMFFKSGGWRDFQPAAIYTRKDFTHWDCAKAGEEGAPLSALCGKGAREQYSAVLSLAARDGWVKGCGLPAVNGLKVIDRFAADLPAERRRQLFDTYQNALRSAEKGPDDRSNCQKLRNRIEMDAREARKVLLSNVQ
jgi:hypothetical protein